MLVPYEDSERAKGVQVDGIYEDVDLMRAGQPNQSWVNAAAFWMNTDANARMFLYDASFIKLREVSVGYDFPRSLLTKLTNNYIRSLKVSFVGRNLAILHQNTPKGLDPGCHPGL